jgi:peptidoglycan hydrolase CwlO-like protein
VYILLLFIGIVFIFLIFVVLFAYMLNLSTLKQQLKEIPFLCFIFVILLISSYAFISNIDINPKSSISTTSQSNISTTQINNNDKEKELEKINKDIKTIKGILNIIE